ncbi:CoA-binding protein [Microcystis aeruginosa]|uniref:CoA-binding domain-containing protein n=1 Tax=Microcystis aeruginosa PCC 9808 TaxID=1160284 RepID=I4I2A7_MICAE|nr:CoA-binding protein [Microcystis aeruginosa]CCI28431.1 hypothetical protein MICAG_4700001 [Microcystis aeruginosa PCC 9808]
MPNIKGDDGALKTIFSNSKIIAVVGHSEKSSRASYQVAKFLQAVGYRGEHLTFVTPKSGFMSSYFESLARNQF